MNEIRPCDIRPGLRVSIGLKKDQRTGKLTEGIVKDILTKSPGIHMASKFVLKTARWDA